MSIHIDVQFNQYSLILSLTSPNDTIMTIHFQVGRLVLYSDGDLERRETGNILLFIGMGLVGIGLVTMVVGLGEKGFTTVGLMMLGPCLVSLGLILVVLRLILG